MSPPGPPVLTVSTPFETETKSRVNDKGDDDDDHDNDDTSLSLCTPSISQPFDHGILMDNGETTWNALTVLYLPIVLLWCRRSMFGTANLIRSILLGQIVHAILTLLPPIDLMVPADDEVSSWTTTTARWLYWASAGNAPTTKHTDTWPPPALTALAVLTFVCFVVHPDGLTWIMLGKIRYVPGNKSSSPIILTHRARAYPPIVPSQTSDTIFAISRSSTTFWTMLIHDYGICSTIAAVMTMATIGCLFAIMLRTLTPRKRKQQSQLLQQQQQQQQHSERKKKKRKGQYPRGRGRLRSTKGIPEHTEDISENVVPESHQLLDNETTNKIVIDTLPPVPEPRAVSPEVEMRPRIQSYSVVESIDDQSTTSSVRSFASAPTVQTIMTTSSERSGKSAVMPTPNVPPAKGKMYSTKSSNGTKKLHGTDKKVTSLAIERGDGQLSPRKQSRSGNNFSRAGPKSLRMLDKNVKNPVVTAPCQSDAFPCPEDNSCSGNQSRSCQLQGTYLHRQQHSPQPSFALVLPDDTHSYFSSTVSINPTSNLNAATPPYTPQRLPSLIHNFGPIGHSSRIALTPLVTPRASYVAPNCSQPYSEQPYSLTWDTTPIRPPPGLEGMLLSSPFGTHPITYAYDEPDDINDLLGDESEGRIEAELQELGGRMVGSVLDF